MRPATSADLAGRDLALVGAAEHAADIAAHPQALSQRALDHRAEALDALVDRSS